MICVSLAERSFRGYLRALRGLELAEIRLDKSPLFGPSEIKALFSGPGAVIAVFRPGPVMASLRKEVLLSAIASGAAYVDIEIEAESRYRIDLIRAAREHGCRVILSYHNERSLPPADRLLSIRERCFRLGADIAKIACRVRSAAECATIFSLYRGRRGRKVIALGLGKPGTITRVAAPCLGAPFTYASAGPGKETAEGQLDRRTLRRILDVIPHA